MRPFCLVLFFKFLVPAISFCQTRTIAEKAIDFQLLVNGKIYKPATHDALTDGYKMNMEFPLVFRSSFFADPSALEGKEKHFAEFIKSSVLRDSVHFVGKLFFYFYQLPDTSIVVRQVLELIKMHFVDSFNTAPKRAKLVKDILPLKASYGVFSDSVYWCLNNVDTPAQTIDDELAYCNLVAMESRNYVMGNKAVAILIDYVDGSGRHRHYFTRQSVIQRDWASEK